MFPLVFRNVRLRFGGWLIQDVGQTRPLKLTDLSRFVAATDVYSRQSDGTSMAAQYARHGIRLRPANMDRVNGWAEVVQGLGSSGGEGVVS